jgi:hypothetical protein
MKTLNLNKVTFFVALCLFAIFNTGSAIREVWGESKCSLPWKADGKEVTIRFHGSISLFGVTEPLCPADTFKVYTVDDIADLFKEYEIKVLTLRQDFTKNNIELRKNLENLIVDSLNKSLSSITDAEKKNLIGFLKPEIDNEFDKRYEMLQSKLYESVSNQILNNTEFLEKLAKKLQKQ